jgi:hypothetical protein
VIELSSRALGEGFEPVPLDDFRTGHPGSPCSTSVDRSGLQNRPMTLVPRPPVTAK